MAAIAWRDFSHITVRVSDIERALAFYRDGLGLRSLFDVELSGPGLESVTGAKGARGRMVGLLVPGSGKVSIELILLPVEDKKQLTKLLDTELRNWQGRAN